MLKNTRNFIIIGRDDLIRSFDREQQIQMGVSNEYVFRVNLGTYGEYGHRRYV